MKHSKSNKIVVYAITILLCGVMFYMTIALFVWILCMAFGMPFTWKAATGVWAAIMLLRVVFSAAHSKG